MPSPKTPPPSPPSGRPVPTPPSSCPPMGNSPGTSVGNGNPEPSIQFSICPFTSKRCSSKTGPDELRGFIAHSQSLAYHPKTEWQTDLPDHLEGGLMQIAGGKCNVCGRSVVLSCEGKCCVQCGTIVHLACEAGPNCHLCGQPYQGYEPPKPNPKSDAFVPRALRPARSGGPVLMLATGLALLFGLLCYCINHALRHSH